MKVNIIESYGELKVVHSETGKALPKVYIKVFSRESYGDDEYGSGEFFRDGYTDICGKFEYA